MGKCVKCGKETKQLYNYYSGEVLNKSTFGTVTKTEYTNIKTHGEYLCNRCVSGKTLIGSTVFSIVFAVILALVIASAVAGNETATVGIMIGFSIPLLINLCIFAYTLSAIKNDKRRDESAIALAFIKGKVETEPDRTYWTPSAYKELETRFIK